MRPPRSSEYLITEAKRVLAHSTWRSLSPLGTAASTRSCPPEPITSLTSRQSRRFAWTKTMSRVALMRQMASFSRGFRMFTCLCHRTKDRLAFNSSLGIGISFAVLLGTFGTFGCNRGNHGNCARNRGDCARTDRPGSAPTVLRRAGKLVLPEGSPLRQRVVVEPVTLQMVQREIVAPATVEAEPSRLAKIAPPLPGRVTRLFVRFEDAVKPGTPLFTIDSPDLVAAQSDFLKAKSAHSQTERNVARQKDLVDHGIGAQRELEQAQTDCDTARSELERSTTRLRLLGMGTGVVGGPLTVTSPIAGRVVELSTATGQYQNDPAAVLMTIADLSTVWVTANIQEKDLRRVHQGDEATATFAAYPGDSFVGKVLFVGALLDTDTRTIKVRIALDNPESRLKPGMFASVSFRGKPVQELVCPVGAVVIIGDKSNVYVETAPWEFERRPIEAVDQVGNHLVVTKGLAFGTRIVTANAVLLQ
jgi:membrane fusion protein, heavy metal efflux system